MIIKETPKLYKDIFADTVSPVAIFNKKGLIEYPNRALANFSNYQLKELIKKPVAVLISEKERERTNTVIQRILKQEINFKELDTFLLTKDKEKIPISFNILPLKDKENKLIGGFAVFVDVTQVQALIKGLDRTKAELEDKVKERTKDLEEAKTILEVKVKARTKELQELNQTLEQQVEKRTEELQERVDELERFHKLTIGRELKMVELKKEIKKLEKK
ncbi:hypothetical protein AMJ49_03720 [Parcubacteria bacterium DG_74_2]|nr:MAG: hypothetical protein AMJ49_03720 [Parcubacteria bacterium DG_74_2]